MENYFYLSMCLILGILFIWYSKHERSYTKTAAVQGEETAKKKFRIIKICGYLLIIGAGVFGIFIIFDV